MEASIFETAWEYLGKPIATAIGNASAAEILKYVRGSGAHSPVNIQLPLHDITDFMLIDKETYYARSNRTNECIVFNKGVWRTTNTIPATASLYGFIYNVNGNFFMRTSRGVFQEKAGFWYQVA